jgi:hypothetical protein
MMAGRDQHSWSSGVDKASDVGSSFRERNLAVEADTFDLRSRSLGHATIAIDRISYTDIVTRRFDLTVRSFLHSISGLDCIVILLVAGRHFTLPYGPVYYIVPRIV